MNSQVYDGQSTATASDADSGSLGLTLGEISALIEPRLSWYRFYGMTLDAVELKDGKAIVAYLSHAQNSAYREVIDIQSGLLVKREVLLDPIVRQLMRSDGISEASIRDLVSGVHKRNLSHVKSE